MDPDTVETVLAASTDHITQTSAVAPATLTHIVTEHLNNPVLTLIDAIVWIGTYNLVYVAWTKPAVFTSAVAGSAWDFLLWSYVGLYILKTARAQARSAYN